MPPGAVAEGPLQTAQGCCCRPSGYGGGWRGARARVWSPRCSPPGPRPAPEPPDGPARRPPAGGGCAPSPRRGSRRLGTGAGSEPGNRAPPSEEGPAPLGQATGSMSPPNSPSIFPLSAQTQNNSPVRTGWSTNSFTLHLPKKDLHAQPPNYLPDSTSSRHPAQPLNSGPTDPSGPHLHTVAHAGPRAGEPLPPSLLNQRLSTL